MAKIKLNQKQRRIEVSNFEIENEIVFQYFDKLYQDKREENLYKALYIGVLALMEDRMSAFLAKTSNELGTELESLKMIFDMKQEIFYKTTIKGTIAEDEIADYLNNYFLQKKINDRVEVTGNKEGKLPKNKTGDIVCYLDGNDEIKIAIEIKFDKSIKLGDINKKDIYTNKQDTAWSQLIEAQANRDSKVSIIVFDISLVDNAIYKNYENVGFIPGIGFICIIDTQKGNFKNLIIAYMLARDIAIRAKHIDLDPDILSILINRTIKDIENTKNIKSMIESNINNNQEILKQLEKSLLSMEFNQEYFSKFLKDGKLNKKDLLDFYFGDKIKEKYKSIEKLIIKE